MASVPNQSNRLSVLDDDDDSVSPDFVTTFKIDCTIRVFQLLSTWIAYSHTPQKHRATITIFISVYIEFRYYFSVNTERGSSNAA